MLVRNSETRWGLVAQLFHWLVFVLVLGAWFAIELHDDAPKGSPERTMWLDYHRAIGLTVFFLVWLRLGWHLGVPAPRALAVSPWQDRLARAVHWGLYGLQILLPVTGVLASQLAGRQVSWFGVFALPTVAAPSQALAERLGDLHTDVLWPLLLVLLGLHIAGAIYHQFIVRDSILMRMLPWGRG